MKKFDRKLFVYSVLFSLAVSSLFSNRLIGNFLQETIESRTFYRINMEDLSREYDFSFRVVYSLFLSENYELAVQCLSLWLLAFCVISTMSFLIGRYISEWIQKGV